jgi:hypothetical protein
MAELPDALDASQLDWGEEVRRVGWFSCPPWTARFDCCACSDSLPPTVQLRPSLSPVLITWYVFLELNLFSRSFADSNFLPGRILI